MPSNFLNMAESPAIIALAIAGVVIIVLLVIIANGNKRGSGNEDITATTLPDLQPAFPDNGEVIAVIAAAIAAIGEEQGKNLKITGIRKKEKMLRPLWGRTGIIDNTRPFIH